jgi:hypothetical protein
MAQLQKVIRPLPPAKSAQIIIRGEKTVTVVLVAGMRVMIFCITKPQTTARLMYHLMKSLLAA